MKELLLGGPVLGFSAIHLTAAFTQDRQPGDGAMARWEEPEQNLSGSSEDDCHGDSWSWVTKNK